MEGALLSVRSVIQLLLQIGLPPCFVLHYLIISLFQGPSVHLA